jgi:Protein of unknown function (DUF2281)
MNVEEKIIEQLHKLPEDKKAEVLDFVKYLRSKTEEKDWSELSMSSSMRGMENEDTPYSLADLKESFS